MAAADGASYGGGAAETMASSKPFAYSLLGRM
jgi:hypothetical protein